MKGVDYGKIFSPVVMLSYVAINHVELNQVDLETAFLYGDLDEQLYMDVSTCYRSHPGIGRV